VAEISLTPFSVESSTIGTYMGLLVSFRVPGTVKLKYLYGMNPR